MPLQKLSKLQLLTAIRIGIEAQRNRRFEKIEITLQVFFWDHLWFRCRVSFPATRFVTYCTWRTLIPKTYPALSVHLWNHGFIQFLLQPSNRNQNSFESGFAFDWRSVICTSFWSQHPSQAAADRALPCWSQNRLMFVRRRLVINIVQPHMCCYSTARNQARTMPATTKLVTTNKWMFRNGCSCH